MRDLKVVFNQRLSFRQSLAITVVFLFLADSLASVLAYLGELNYYFNLASNFRLQLLIAQVFLLVLISCFRHQGRLFLTLCPFILINLLPVFPYYVYSAQQSGPIVQSFKLLDSNVFVDNPSFEKLIQLIASEKPDIVALEETDERWYRRTNKILSGMYPYWKTEPRSNPFGMVLYSKFPLSDAQIRYFGDFKSNGRDDQSAFPFIQAKVHLKERDFTILVCHPLPPGTAESTLIRDSQLADIAWHRSEFGENLVVVGDLNAAPWTPGFQKLLAGTGLRDSQLGFGVQPSWPTMTAVQTNTVSPWEALILQLMRVPIDHVVVSGNFAVLKRKIGPDIGSDHLPVIVELGLRKSTRP